MTRVEALEKELAASELNTPCVTKNNFITRVGKYKVTFHKGDRFILRNKASNTEKKIEYILKYMGKSSKIAGALFVVTKEEFDENFEFTA